MQRKIAVKIPHRRLQQHYQPQQRQGVRQTEYPPEAPANAGVRPACLRRQQQRAAKQQRQHTGGHPWHGAVVSSQQRACGQAAQGVADAASQPYASVRDGTFLQRLQDQTVAQRLYAGIKQREQAADNRHAGVALHQPQQAQ